jgi:hypothetical protein
MPPLMLVHVAPFAQVQVPLPRQLSVLPSQVPVVEHEQPALQVQAPVQVTPSPIGLHELVLEQPNW